MNDPNEQRPKARPRRPYTPPAIEESGRFERLALSCGHVPMSTSKECDPGEGGSTNS